MGCDIHLILEACTPTGEWVAVQSTSAINAHDTNHDYSNYYAHPLRAAKMRDYDLFAILSNVRGYAPNGQLLKEDLPADASAWSERENSYDHDLHSQGWSTFSDLDSAIVEVTPDSRRQNLLEWLQKLTKAAALAREEASFLVPSDHDYDEYGLSAHAVLELRNRHATELEDARARYAGAIPSVEDADNWRVIVAYDN